MLDLWFGLPYGMVWWQVGEGEAEGEGLVTRARFQGKDRIKSSLRIVSRLVLGFGFNFRVRARFTLNVMVSCG